MYSQKRLTRFLQVVIMQTLDGITSNSYRTGAGKVCRTEMINTIINNPKYQQIPDYPYRILIKGCYGSGKTN